MRIMMYWHFPLDRIRPGRRNGSRCIIASTRARLGPGAWQWRVWLLLYSGVRIIYIYNLKGRPRGRRRIGVAPAAPGGSW